jgi:hypothetical protein
MNQGIQDMNLVDIDLEPREAPEGVSPVIWKQWEDEEALKQDKFLWQLKRGIQGHNVGFDNGRTHLNKYLHGTHKARYYLIGGESGAGKTTIGDFMYVLRLWFAAKAMNRRIKIVYLSYEIGKVEKMYRWCSYFIFLKYGIRLPSDYLQGHIQGRPPSGRHVEMILEAYTTVRQMLDSREVVIVEDVQHPTAVFEGVIRDVFEPNGKVERDTVAPEEAKKGKKGYIRGYTEHDPDLMTMIVVDHLALTGSEMGLDTKGVMDKMSKYMIVLRNMFHCSGLFIQQFSTDMMSAYRSNYGKKDQAAIKPTRLDFGDSKATFRDADVVKGYIKPQTEMDNFYDYNLASPKKGGLGQYFVAEYLMKNRYGPSGKLLPLFVDYVTGWCCDLPLNPEDTEAIKPFLEYAKQIEQVCQDYSPISR